MTGSYSPHTTSTSRSDKKKEARSQNERAAILASFFSASLLLLIENRFEHRFLDIRLEVAGGRVDERVGSAAPNPRVFLLHVVLRRVIPQLYVARQRAHKFEGPV